MGCEYPKLMVTLVPTTAALKPTPWISSFLTKPSLTPRTMLFTRARLRPCNALACASSPSRLTTTLPSSTFRLVRRGSSQLSLPFGPSTRTFWPLTSTFTFGGMAIGCFPIRDINSNSDGALEHQLGCMPPKSTAPARYLSAFQFHLLTTRNKSTHHRSSSASPAHPSADLPRSIPRPPPAPRARAESLLRRHTGADQACLHGADLR